MLAALNHPTGYLAYLPKELRDILREYARPRVCMHVSIPNEDASLDDLQTKGPFVLLRGVTFTSEEGTWVLSHIETNLRELYDFTRTRHPRALGDSLVVINNTIHLLRPDYRRLYSAFIYPLTKTIEKAYRYVELNDAWMSIKSQVYKDMPYFEAPTWW